MNFSKNTLKEYDLRHTGCREDILQSFQSYSHALSHGDLETLFGERFDRVTIYRTLKTFVEKGIIHKVLDDEGGTKYALCRSTTTCILSASYVAIPLVSRVFTFQRSIYQKVINWPI